MTLVTTLQRQRQPPVDDSFAVGPGNHAYISHYEITADGTYYVRVSRWGGSTDNYQLRVERARGIDLESDAHYDNDTLANADPITFGRRYQSDCDRRRHHHGSRKYEHR